MLVFAGRPVIPRLFVFIDNVCISEIPFLDPPLCDPDRTHLFFFTGGVPEPAPIILSRRWRRLCG
jgi:hypothetical protein